MCFSSGMEGGASIQGGGWRPDHCVCVCVYHKWVTLNLSWAELWVIDPAIQHYMLQCNYNRRREESWLPTPGIPTHPCSTVCNTQVLPYPIATCVKHCCWTAVPWYCAGRVLLNIRLHQRCLVKYSLATVPKCISRLQSIGQVEIYCVIYWPIGLGLWKALQNTSSLVFSASHTACFITWKLRLWEAGIAASVMDNCIPYTISGATPYSTLFMVPPWFQENGISTREGKELEGKRAPFLIYPLRTTGEPDYSSYIAPFPPTVTCSN